MDFSRCRSSRNCSCVPADELRKLEREQKESGKVRVKESQAAEAKAPAAQTQAPAAETEAPAEKEEPAAETEAAAAETKTSP